MYPTQIFVDAKYQKLNRVYNAMQSLGLGADWMKDVQPIDLKLEALIDPSKNVLSFQTRKGTNNTDLSDEIRVDTNDLVFITHLAVAIRKIDKSTTPFSFANTPAYFYPDSNAFPGTKSGNAAEAAALETVYGGKLGLKTGNLTIFDEVAMQRFRKLPDNPYAVATTTPAANAVHASFDLAKVYEDLAQIFCLYGSQNYEFQLTYGTGDRTIADGSYNAAGSAIAATGTRNEVVIFAQGFKVVGGCSAALRQEVRF